MKNKRKRIKLTKQENEKLKELLLLNRCRRFAGLSGIVKMEEPAKAYEDMSMEEQMLIAKACCDVLGYMMDEDGHRRMITRMSMTVGMFAADK